MFIVAIAPAEVNRTPAEVNRSPAIIFALPASADVADDYRPTAGPEFIPTAEEEAEAAELLNGDDEPTDAEWDAMADDVLALDMVCSGHWTF